MKLKNLIACVGVVLSLVCMGQGRDKASFVWSEPTGKGRQVFVYFRNDINIDAAPEKAQLNLFADSRYQLFVNGTVINFGPARFYPKHPQYDTYDIAPFLKIGKNTIAVKALSNGVHTFQTPKHVGGFIAWGEIVSASGKTDLGTPGNWLCKPSKGYDQQTPKVSFALHILESFDARKDQPDWNLPSADLSDWQKTILLTNQNAWGILEPRTIPHLTQNAIVPKQITGVYELKDDNDIYSYRIKVPDEEDSLYRSSYRLFAYTYIYSPKKQLADINGWWSEFWLNGDSVGYDQPSGGLVKRIWHLNLNEGWNYLFVKYGSTDGIWDAHYVVPKKYNLIFSADKNKNSDVAFYTAGPFTRAEKDKVMKIKLPLASPQNLPKLSATWVPRKNTESAGNPAWNIIWSQLGQPIDIHPSSMKELTSSKPIAWIGDMGGKQLARFIIDIDAPEGTIVEVAFTEDTIGNRPWVMKRPMLNLAARFVAREGKNHFETFNPYGCRFLQVNVTNNNNKPFTIKKIEMVSQVYPFVKKGSFACSDPMFNALWESGWRTLQVCSEDAYVDTPFRERGLYAGDCLPEFATTLAASGDPLLIKRSLELFSDMYAHLFSDDYSGKKRNTQGSNISDFPMITTLFYDWYFQRTNDLDLLKKLYPGYKKMIMDAVKNQQSTGLIKTNGIFVEWSKIEKKNYCNTFANALYARNCEVLAKMASLLGLPNDAAWFSDKSKQVIDAIQKNCWDRDKNAFCDGYLVDGPLKNYYPISSASMSLFGYTTPEQEKKLSSFYEESLRDVSIKVRRDGLATSYGGFYVLGGLYRGGNAALAEYFIRRYWSPMLLYMDDTLWEDFTDNSESLSGGTMSHAWSSAPTYYMTSQVLGVQLGFPVEANTSVINIEPQAESITWAKGDVPHPKGNIHVEWNIQGDNLFVSCSMPAGIGYNVKPRGKLATYNLWVNGEKK